MLPNDKQSRRPTSTRSWHPPASLRPPGSTPVESAPSRSSRKTPSASRWGICERMYPCAATTPRSAFNGRRQGQKKGKSTYRPGPLASVNYGHALERAHPTWWGQLPRSGHIYCIPSLFPSFPPPYNMNLEPFLLLASEEGPDPWWKVVVGIIAIPAGLLGLLYTFRLAQKTRLESLKLERELSLPQSDDSATRSDSEVLHDAEKRAAQAGVIAARTQNFIVRFIILDVAVRAWSAIVFICMPLISLGTNLYFSRLRAEPDHDWQSTETLRHIVATFEIYLSSFGYVMLFFLIGWPLLKDVTAALGITPRQLISLKRLK